MFPKWRKMKFYYVSYSYIAGQYQGFGSTILEATGFVPMVIKTHVESALNKQFNRGDANVIIISKTDLTEEEYKLELKARRV